MHFGFTSDLFSWYKRVGEIPFDSERKLMTTINKIGDKFFVFTKGGLDELLEKCIGFEENKSICLNKQKFTEQKNEIYNVNEKMAKNALRVLGIGYKVLDKMPTSEEMIELENNLVFLGLVGMIDPARKEAYKAIEECKQASITPIMITGDHKITAEAIARDIGILGKDQLAITGQELDELSDIDFKENIEKYRVYARVSPANKLRIVQTLQKKGHVVAMTGDGVNDAPALKKADIGCSMGITGTDVTKEASDLILVDDNFKTIVSAVKEGRRIYDNIMKIIQYFISSNVSEVLIILFTILFIPFIRNKFNIPLDVNIMPFLPIHLLFINLFTDSLIGLSLSIDEASEDVMNRKPKKKNEITNKNMIYRIVYQRYYHGCSYIHSIFYRYACRVYKSCRAIKNGTNICIHDTNSCRNIPCF